MSGKNIIDTIDMKVLQQIAHTAGDAILKIYEQETIAVETKADNSPLTLADLAAHNCIVSGLTALTPNIPVVSEEDSSSLIHRTASGTFWLIDPLDGTKEFVARNGEFTVNIALIENGSSVLGVVYAPAQHCMYWGRRHEGAYRDDGHGVQRIETAATRNKERPCRVVASKSHLNAETSEFIARLGPSDLVQAGSSLKFCRIAEGLADLYPRLAPTCEWDTAAAQAVLEAAGGLVVDSEGRPLTYGKPGILNPHFIAAASVAWLPNT